MQRKCDLKNMDLNLNLADMNNITDIYAVKILLCYFLKKINRPVTPNQLLEIATGTNIVNYFSYNHAVDSMLKTDLIEEKVIDNVSHYILTDMGAMGAEEFKTMAPKTSREKILSAGLKFFTKLKNENTVSFEIVETDKGCEVKCRCVDNGLILMELSLFAPDMEQAEFIRQKIKINPQAFYGNVMSYVLDNEEYIPDIND